MILISILWYERLQIKLACYKTLNIKHWIHLDMFAQTGNVKNVEYCSLSEEICNKYQKQNISRITKPCFWKYHIFVYFHTILGKCIFALLNDFCFIIQINLHTLETPFLLFYIVCNNNYDDGCLQPWRAGHIINHHNGKIIITFKESNCDNIKWWAKKQQHKMLYICFCLIWKE